MTLKCLLDPCLFTYTLPQGISVLTCSVNICYNNRKIIFRPKMGKIKLLSNEGEGFELDTEVAKKSEVIKEMLENCDDSSEDVPLPTISSDQLRKVVQWLEQHRGDVVMDRLKGEDRDYNSDNIPEWDKKFFNLSQVELFDLILAANDVQLSFHFCFCAEYRTSGWPRITIFFR